MTQVLSHVFYTLHTLDIIKQISKANFAKFSTITRICGMTSIHAFLIIGMYDLSDKYMIPDLKLTVVKDLIDMLYCTDDSPTSYDPEAGPRCIAIAARKIYLSTTESDWCLRESVLQAILERTQPESPYKDSSFYQKVIQEIPDLAVDLAASTLSPPMRCRRCEKQTRQRNWACKCGRMDDCLGQSCKIEKARRRFCKYCSQFGLIDDFAV